MSGVLIVEPESISATAVSSGTGAANLLTRSPREVWVASSTAAQIIDIDLGIARPIDSFFLGATNADAAASWTISKATGLGAGLTAIKAAGAMRAADSMGPPHHAFHRLAEPVTSRYFRLSLAQGGADPLYVGRLIVGLAFEQWREFGGGRQPVDTGSRQSQSDGGFGTSDGVVKALFNWTFGDLTNTEINRLWGISARLGLRKPCVVVEDADLAEGQNEAIHYGVFARFQSYERREADWGRWVFSHEEWR